MNKYYNIQQLSIIVENKHSFLIIISNKTYFENFETLY